MDTVASKMEDIAKGVIRVLSDNVKNAKDSALSTEAPSTLRLRLHYCNISKPCYNTDPSNSCALSILVCGRDRQICLRNQGGTSFFSLLAGSMLLTFGTQIQELSNGEFKSAVGEELFEKTDEQDPSISLELLYSPGDLHLSEVGRHSRCIDRPKLVSFRDQILIALVLLSFFYIFWC